MLSFLFIQHHWSSVSFYWVVRSWSSLHYFAFRLDYDTSCRSCTVRCNSGMILDFLSVQTTWHFSWWTLSVFHVGGTCFFISFEGWDSLWGRIIWVVCGALYILVHDIRVLEGGTFWEAVDNRILCISLHLVGEFMETVHMCIRWLARGCFVWAMQAAGVDFFWLYADTSQSEDFDLKLHFY